MTDKLPATKLWMRSYMDLSLLTLLVTCPSVGVFLITVEERQFIVRPITRVEEDDLAEFCCWFNLPDKPLDVAVFHDSIDIIPSRLHQKYPRKFPWKMPTQYVHKIDL